MRRFLLSLGMAAVVLLAGKVGEAAAAADLVVLGASPTGPNSVVVRVRNIGNAPAGPCRLAMWVHQNPGGAFLGGPYFVSVPALAPGQFGSVTVTTPAAVTVTPHRILRFFIDYGNIVPEGPNEGNNGYTLFVP